MKYFLVVVIAIASNFCNGQIKPELLFQNISSGTDHFKGEFTKLQIIHDSILYFEGNQKDLRGFFNYFYNIHTDSIGKYGSPYYGSGFANRYFNFQLVGDTMFVYYQVDKYSTDVEVVDLTNRNDFRHPQLFPGSNQILPQASIKNSLFGFYKKGTDLYTIIERDKLWKYYWNKIDSVVWLNKKGPTAFTYKMHNYGNIQLHEESNFALQFHNLIIEEMGYVHRDIAKDSAQFLNFKRLPVKLKPFHREDLVITPHYAIISYPKNTIVLDTTGRVVVNIKNKKSFLLVNSDSLIRVNYKKSRGISTHEQTCQFLKQYNVRYGFYCKKLVYLLSATGDIYFLPADSLSNNCSSMK